MICRDRVSARRVLNMNAEDLAEESSRALCVSTRFDVADSIVVEMAAISGVARLLDHEKAARVSGRRSQAEGILKSGRDQNGIDRSPCEIPSEKNEERWEKRSFDQNVEGARARAELGDWIFS